MDVTERLTLRQLRYFIAIAEERSIRCAADRLNISQPPLSRQLHDLEETLAVPLFTRGPRGVSLTQEGQELYGRAKDILSRLNQAYHETQHIHAGASGSLAIGYTDDFQYGLFAQKLSAFMAAHPAIYLRLEQGYSSELASIVDQGELDLALISPPLQPGLTETAIAPLDTVPLKVMTARGSALATKRCVSMADIKDQRFILGSLRPGSGFYLQVMNLFRRAKITPSLQTDIYPTAMIANLVAQGHGISLITPDSLDQQRRDVVLLDLEDKDAVIERAIIWRRGSATRAARRFYQALTGKTLEDSRD